MAMPLVSVVIPARNAERTIASAITSVLEQTVTDLEVVVVDDASTDATPAITAGSRDRRIRLLRSERNVREAAARNIGIREARGKWIAFLDADDEYTPRRLENLLRASGESTACFLADIEVLAVPGPRGRLVQAAEARQPADGGAESLDLAGFLAHAYDARMMVPTWAFTERGLWLPEWGSGGEWIFLLSMLLANGLEGRMVRRVGYLYRAAAAHDCSSLLAREEHLRVIEFLSSRSPIPAESKDLLRRGIPDAYERLVAAALRRRDVRKFLRYARRRPSALVRLPRRALLFGLAKARVAIAQSAASRRGASRAAATAGVGRGAA